MNRQPLIDSQLREVLAKFPQITLVILFGSLAAGRQTPDSDLDVAIAAEYPLSVDEKIAIIGTLAEHTGRVVDLIDLKTVTEPLLGQIVRHGRRILGSSTLHGNLINRHLLEQEDFMPYRNRILAERRRAWIEK